MIIEEFMKEQRRLRDRARRSGMKARLQEIRLQAEMLCDSHENKQRELLNRMLKSLIEALKAYKLDEDQKQLLVEHFTEAGIDMPHVARSGNSLRLEGNFDIRELAKRMVWQGVYDEEMRGVGEEED
jgi:hypothetical protein